MLNNYEELLSSRTICEGRCSMGEQCPTGVCRSSEPKRSRRRSSRSQTEMKRSPSSTSVRPRSGPAKLCSYTGGRRERHLYGTLTKHIFLLGSAPPSRAGSRLDIAGDSGSMTAPTTPRGSPPVTPRKKGKTAKDSSVSVPLTEIPDSQLTVTGTISISDVFRIEVKTYTS